jgi:DNA end-binding protein Ku
MPRTMWKGAISFGLVSIPIRVFPATEEKTLRFNQLHDKDGGRIKYQRVCAVCGEEVPFEHIVKGYEYEKDRYVILSDEDFDAVPVESSRAIDIVQFVDSAEIDPILYKKSYYLAPEETGVKAYKLLREAMSEDGRVGVAKVSFRDKEHLAALRFSGDVLVLETMFWPDEIRAADFEELDRDVKLRPQEVQMAQSLIENLTEEWDPDQFKDEYRRALLDIVEKKAAGEEIVAPEEPEPARVVDLMEALKASVDAAKKGRKPTAVPDAEEEEEEKPAPKAKTSARKKSTARRKAG